MRKFLIDKDDEKKVSERSWAIGAHGYITSSWNKKTRKQENMRLHRFLLGLEKDDKRQVDHINGNKLDNRKSNLRICTASQNNMNMSITKKNTSGYKGIYFMKYPKNRQWSARISCGKQRIWLGSFSTKEEASKAYNYAAIKYHGDFAYLNK